MPSLHFLGTGSAITDPHRTTTMLAFEDAGSILVIDCGGDVVQRLLQSGLVLDQISAVILTHEHPDHVAGFPLMVQKLWLAGRRDPIPVHGIPAALAQARACFAAFDTSGWEGLPAIPWLEFPHTPNAPVLNAAPWRLTAIPSAHGVPSVALRIEHLPSGRVCVYSSDTAPFEEMIPFARGAHLLIHEASGEFPGHSTAADAARIAAQANAGALYLVHLPPESQLDSARLAAAREIFPNTFKAGELDRIGF
ncbi:MAG: MBL fold metallo-hydrolase [Chthoniobacteraceae bacterium]|jgi:ribonuclease Z